MEPVVMPIGRSLSVPSVQELAKEALTSVPKRYIRADQDLPLTTSPQMASATEIPVIDTQRLLVFGDSMELSTELRKLHCACKGWGFFQLINHGVSLSVVEKMKHESKVMFELTKEEKEKLRQEPGDLQGFGQAFVVSEEQKLDWGDLFFIIILPPHLRKPTLFSQLPQSFIETVDVYSREVKDLAKQILNFMAKALKVEEEGINKQFEDVIQIIRLNYYPPCPQPELVMGLTPHSDAVGLTILLQANEIEGLQIKKDGMWIPVKPLPDAFVVNVGDILEIITNGIYRSIEHRAVVNAEKERLSIATFHNLKLDGDIGPSPGLITPGTPALFKRISVVDYLKGQLSRELLGKSYLDTLRIQKEWSAFIWS